MNNAGLQKLFLDLNSFFASVEQLYNPTLRGRPVAVLPLESEHTCAIAASVEAKVFGIKTGTSVAEARQRCPHIVFLPARHDRYVEVHHQVIETVSQLAEIEAVCSIDEMVCFLPQRNCPAHTATALAHAIKHALHQRFDGALTCSIGIASNRFLAKLGSDLQKPNGLVVLDPATMPAPILDLPIQELCGIGHNMQRRLNKAGIWSVAHLWPLSAKHLRQLWHSVEGEAFWYKLHGFELPTKPTEKSVIGHSRILDPILRPPAMAENMASRLVLKACQRLRRYQLLASRFDISVRTQADPYAQHATGMRQSLRWSKSIHLHPTDDSMAFLRILHGAWPEMVQALRNPQALKKVSIALHGLSVPAETSGDLFEHAAQSQRASQFKPAPSLNAALDALNQKFGAQTVQIGLTPKSTAGFVGTKIAFNRIPEQAEFFE